jgi:hypothetical protein
LRLTDLDYLNSRSLKIEKVITFEMLKEYRMKMRFVFVVTVFLVLPLLSSCRKDRYKVNTSTIDVQIEIKRLEKDLFVLNPDEIAGSVPSLRTKYNGFLQLFSNVINTGNISDPSFADFLVRFCTDRINNEAYSAVMKLFPDISSVEKDLEEAFRHYIYYFPDRKVPSVFTCITGFNNSIITGDSALGISLDRYLGADSEFYKRLEIYKYIASRMTPENIVPDAIYGWGASDWDFSVIGYPAENALSRMIHAGKLRYFEKCMLPETSDEIIQGFTASQLAFCTNNEEQMWTYIIENDLLFSTDQFTIRKLVEEAPFTSYFTGESPGRAAVWIGFRIVESYMEKNKNVSLGDLMAEKDFQKILEQARYDPH